MQSLFFSIFSEVKNMLSLYTNNGKPETLVSQLNNFLILEAKKYFYCKKACEKS